jgi:nitrogen regulatory protein PII
MTHTSIVSAATAPTWVITDSIGDGKIFVLELASATRIRTGETGDTAL